MPVEPNISHPLTQAFTLTTPTTAIVGIACISIPILIHLIFRRKRKPVDWATMKFIRQAWETKKRRILLQKNILLFIRCCIPLLLGLALAEPLLDTMGPWGNNERNAYIIIDDGIVSATSSTGDETDLEQSKRRAVELIDDMDPETRIHILTTTNPTRSMKPLEDHAAAKAKIETIHPRQAPTRLTETLTAIKRQRRESTPTDSLDTIHILSSFREGSVHNLKKDESGWSGWHQLTYSNPATNSVSNTRIKSAQPLRSLSLDDSEIGRVWNKIIIELSRDGDTLPEGRNQIRLDTSNGTTTSDVSWDSGQRSKTTYVEIPDSNTGINTVTINLVEEDALPFDDVRYAMTRSLKTVKMIQLADDSTLTSSEPDWVGMAIDPARSEAIEILRFHPTALQETDLDDASVILITAPDQLDRKTNTMLDRYFKQGGLIIVTPPGNPDIDTSWLGNINESFGVELLADPRTTTNTSGVGMTTTGCSTTTLSLISDELPNLLESARAYKWINLKGEETTEILLRTDGGTPLISIHESDSDVSRLVLLSFNLDTSWTNIPTQPIIIPLIQEIIWGSLSDLNSGSRYTTGEYIQTRMKNPGFISLGNETRITFDSTTGKTKLPVDTPGFWLIENSTENTIQVNVDPAFSSTNTTQTQIIQDTLGPEWRIDSDPNLVGTNAGTFDLQSLLLYLLASMVVVETILARFFSHTSPAKRLRPA